MPAAPSDLGAALTHWLITLFAGSLVGCVLGLIGGGGSILAVPLLLYVVGIRDPHVAIGTSALAVGANAAANLVGHWRLGNVKLPCAIAFATAGVLGALAGSSLPLDPDFVAAELGFAARFENSMDAVSDRDFVAEALFDLALIGIHLSRMGEEIVFWSSEEFAFCTVDDAFASGSSMLPQKKNADAAELARGKAGRLIGNLTGLLVTLKGLPLAYNRDLQEDKEPLFDSVRQVGLAVAAMAGTYATLSVHATTLAAAADAGAIAAIDLAEFLVVAGVPFREAHAIVATHVRRSIDEGVALAALVAEDPRLGPDAASLLAPGVAVTRRTTPGGAGPIPVATQLARFTAALAADWARLGQRP